MNTFAQAVALLKSGVDLNIENSDIGPRFESLLNQSVYLGIWCYSNADNQRFSVEVREIEESGTWLEDDVSFKSGSEIRFFCTFDDAFAQVSEIITALADRSPV